MRTHPEVGQRWWRRKRSFIRRRRNSDKRRKYKTLRKIQHCTTNIGLHYIELQNSNVCLQDLQDITKDDSTGLFVTVITRS